MFTTHSTPSLLSDTIADLRERFTSLQDEIDDLREENDALRGELERGSFEARQLQSVDLRALRRRVALYCHPDRGGSNQVMCDLNVLFDALESGRGGRGA